MRLWKFKTKIKHVNGNFGFYQSWCINPEGICNDLNLFLSNWHNFQPDG